MNALNILIVEDDTIIAESISDSLRALGYTVLGVCRSYDTAISFLQDNTPDFLLLDIGLSGKFDGIQLARYITRERYIPFIFITGKGDANSISRALEVQPLGYLVKPFNIDTLYASIEIAVNNYNNGLPLNKKALNDFVFIKDRELFYKVPLNEIVYLESDNVYLNIYAVNRKFVIRCKLDDFIKSVGTATFVRTHRSFAVNIKHIQVINSISLVVAGIEIPLNKAYKTDLLSMANQFR